MAVTRKYLADPAHLPAPPLLPLSRCAFRYRPGSSAASTQSSRVPAAYSPPIWTSRPKPTSLTSVRIRKQGSKEKHQLTTEADRHLSLAWDKQAQGPGQGRANDPCLGGRQLSPRFLLTLCLICMLLKEGFLDPGAHVDSGDYCRSKGGSTGEEKKSARRRRTVEEEDEEEDGKKRQIRGLHNEPLG